jgi:hypothetical protein
MAGRVFLNNSFDNAFRSYITKQNYTSEPVQLQHCKWSQIKNLEIKGIKVPAIWDLFETSSHVGRYIPLSRRPKK